MTTQLHQIIELHDTTLAAIIEVGMQVIVVMRAYIHKSEGRPGWDAGSGWIQAVVLNFVEGRIEGSVPELPTDIWQGDLNINGEVMKNTIPIPLSYVGEVSLSLQLDALQPLIITGKGVELTLIGEPIYVEEFPGADGQ